MRMRRRKKREESKKGNKVRERKGKGGGEF